MSAQPVVAHHVSDEAGVVAGHGGAVQSHPTATKQNPLAVGHSPEGGVSIAGQSGLPEGHASGMDKVVGGIDKVLAAATFDKAGVETAKLRSTGGKAAALGQARAPVEEL